MKNLKKVLSLVLACTTAFTVMASAAFTDSADIKSTEAVEMLAQLGVIAGYTDGSYKPDATVTRAEMAKMIYVARTGSTDASSYANISTTFTDISGHWAAGFIKYCQTNGIIAGKSATKFDPDATVTGTEAAKMLLVTMGYQSDKAGLTGASWSTNTLNLASDNNLLDDVDSDMTAALPRQYAAQIIYNTLDADRVKWSTDSNSFDYYTDGNDNRETVGEKYLGLYTDVGILTTIDGDNLKISQNGSERKDSYTYKDSDKDSDELTTVNYTSVESDFSDLLGQEVKVMFKDKKTNNVLGVYATDKNTVYTVNSNAVEDDSAKVKFNSQSYSLESDGIKVYYTDVNGDEVSAILSSTAAKTDIDENTLTSDDGVFYNGYYEYGFAALDNTSDEITFIDSDANGKLDTAIITQVLAGEVTYVSDSKVLVDGVSSTILDDDIDPEDDTVASGITTDDWATVTYNRYDENYVVAVADTASGTLTGTKDDSNDAVDAFKKYKIDGTWYAGTTESGADLKSVKATATVSYVLVNGVVYQIKKTSGTSGSASDLDDVALVTAKSTTGIEDQVKLQFFNDTTKTVTVDGGNEDSSTTSTVDTNGDDDGLWDYESINVGQVYEVSTSGDDYQFETVNTEDDYYGDYTALSDGTELGDTATKTGEKVDGYKIDDTAKVIVFLASSGTTSEKSGDVDVITGKQFKSSTMSVVTTLKSVAFKAEIDGLDRVGALAVGVNGISTTGTSYDNYAYVVDDAYSGSNSNIEYQIWTGSDTLTVTDEDNTTSKIKKGTVIGYSSISSDNVISDAEVISAATSSKAGVVRTAVTKVNDDQDTISIDAALSSSGYVTTDGQTELDISDAKVLYVDSDASDSDDVGSESGTIKTASKNDSTYAPYKYTPNVLVYSLDDDDSVEFVVFDIGGEIASDDTPYAAKLTTLSEDKVSVSVSSSGSKTGYDSTVSLSTSASTLAYTSTSSSGYVTITVTPGVDADTTATATVALTVTNASTSATSLSFSAAELQAGTAKTFTVYAPTGKVTVKGVLS